MRKREARSSIQAKDGVGRQLGAQEQRRNSTPAPRVLSRADNDAKSADAVSLGLRKLIFDQADDVTSALLRKAREGSCQHAKFLFELAGLFPAAAADTAEADTSLARYVLERLDMEDMLERAQAELASRPGYSRS